jgi:hypothetical protein
MKDILIAMASVLAVGSAGGKEWPRLNTRWWRGQAGGHQRQFPHSRLMARRTSSSTGPEWTANSAARSARMKKLFLMSSAPTSALSPLLAAQLRSTLDTNVPFPPLNGGPEAFLGGPSWRPRCRGAAHRFAQPAVGLSRRRFIFGCSPCPSTGLA